MAARKSAVKDEAEKTYDRISVDEAVVDDLAEDDRWTDIITKVQVPPYKIKGIVIPQPTKEQVDDWASTTLTDPVKAEKILMGADAYEKVQELFRSLPQSAYATFQDDFMNHMFRYQQR
jgi:hypothetical protein